MSDFFVNFGSAGSSSGGGGGISGSGTTNYLARWSSSSALTDSIIQDNGSSIGINASPTGHKKLNVVSDAFENTCAYFENAYDSGVGGQFPNYGVNGKSTNIQGVAVGGLFEAYGDTPFSVQLVDGTEANGKFLKCVDNLGYANWGTITISDVSGAVGGSGTTNFLSKWSSSSALTNSIIEDNGSQLSIGEAIDTTTKLNVIATGSMQFAFKGENSLVNAFANYGGYFKAISGSENYSLQLIDNTEATGKFLKCVDSFGSANWGFITERDVYIQNGSGTLLSTTYTFDCATQMNDILSGSASNCTLSFTNARNGITYTFVYIQGTNGINLIMPSGKWLNNTSAFDFTTLNAGEQAMVTATYLGSSWYFAGQKLV